MKIDQFKLREILESALEDVKEPGFCASGCCIGVIDGAQIQLNVTRDADDRWPVSKKNRCVLP